MLRPHTPELGETYELVEEILIRIPPDDPAGLIRASLVCKAWCRLLSGHAFRGRYRAFHRTPPILGFLQSWEEDVERFVPTTNFHPRNPEPGDSFVLDCRHGRVLLGCENDEDDDDEEEQEERVEEEEDSLNMVVWDPVSGSRTEVPEPDFFRTNYSAAVLCAAEGCNHIACNIGPFSVAFIGLHNDEDDDMEDDQDTRIVWASVYSSETRKWTSPASIAISIGVLAASLMGRPGVIIGRALYFLLRRDQGLGILKYDLGRRRLSVIDLPELCARALNPILVSAADGELGLVDLDQHGLCTMWSMEVSLDGVVAWIQLREMDLKVLLPIGNPTGLHSHRLKLVGCVEGTDIIVLVTQHGAFAIDLKSRRSRKLSSKPYEDTLLAGKFENLFLYTSFNSPPGVVVEPRASEARSGDPEI